jgi:hypothetical protein
MFVTVSHFQSGLMFVSKAGAYQGVTPYGTPLHTYPTLACSFRLLKVTDSNKRSGFLQYGIYFNCKKVL